jgi:hypothetical protein
LNKATSKNEINAAKSEFQALQKTRDIEMRFHKTHYKSAVLSYIYDHFTFELFLSETTDSVFRYYNELAVFCTLYRDYVSLLARKKELSRICGDFNSYITFYNKSGHKYLTEDLTLLWSRIFIHSQADASTKKALSNIIVRKEYNIHPFEFYLHIKLAKKDLHLKMINETELEMFEKDNLKPDQFFQDYIDACFQFSIMYSGINETKSVDFFIKGVNDGILRHGWRKDYIVSYLLVDAFEIILRNKWSTENELRKYAENVFDLTIRVTFITDGKGTHQGPYTLIERISLYDHELASLLQKQLQDETGGYRNSTAASIIKSKIVFGLPIDEVEKEMKGLRIKYNYKGNPEYDYFIEKFKIYLKIAKNEFYTDNERKLAFNNAYQEIEEILEQVLMEDYSYINFFDELGDDLYEFEVFCNRFNKEFKIPKNKDENQFKSKKYDPVIEAEFLNNLSRIRNKQALDALYEKLYKYDNNIQLHNQESWQRLVETTFEISGSISSFVNFLEKNSYPHLDHMTKHGKFLHFGLAAALANINTRKETMGYLSKKSGHGGFVNTMKAYEVLRDREMCLALFNRFLQFCKFLVY